MKTIKLVIDSRKHLACGQQTIIQFLHLAVKLKAARTFIMTLVFIVSGFVSFAETWQTLCWFTGANGALPAAALTLGTDGNFYGTTANGGSAGYGTVFKVTTNGVLTTLVSFNGYNGKYPDELTLGPDGNFYGATVTDLWGGYGTVFKVTTNGTLTTLAFFSGNDGSGPTAALTLGPDRNFYGTTVNGGNSGYGTAFKVTTNGVLTTMVSFSIARGANPYAALTLGLDGNFYGTTQCGGTTNSQYLSGMGTIFRLPTNGPLTTLVYFSGTNGVYPTAPLTQGADGYFYGTTKYGGSNGQGTVFKVNTNGDLTTLDSFSITNGANPVASLTLGADNNFYGTTEGGGNTALNSGYGYGTVFKVATNGALTTLVSFPGYDYYNGDNGASPYAGLTLGPDGNFYGTTGAGGVGSSIKGTVFRLLNSLLITVQPTSLLVQDGTTATFNVSATSAAPLNYQWALNGTNIAGATNSALTIFNVHLQNLGYYQALVSNGYASTNSNISTLTMSPSLVSPFGGAMTVWGKIASLSVGAVGSGQLSYQWFQNGVAIAGANNATLNFGSIQFTNGGMYSVVVTSAYGSITNAAYQVVVNPANISLGFSPTLTIGGVVGYSYIIQSTTNLANTNAWVTLTNLTLTQPVQLWVDTNVDASSPFNSKTFYKILPGQ